VGEFRAGVSVGDLSGFSQTGTHLNKLRGKLHFKKDKNRVWARRKSMNNNNSKKRTFNAFSNQRKQDED